MKIQKRLLIIILSLMIAMGAISLLVSRDISTNIIKHQITNHLISTTQSKAAHIKTLLNSEKEVVRQSSKWVVIKELLSSTKEKEDYPIKFNRVMLRLQDISQVEEDTYDIFILDTKGTIIASSAEEEIGEDKSNDPYFLGGKEGVFIKDVYISSHQQEKTLAFSAPVLDEDNKLLGVVVMRRSLKLLFEITTDPTGLGQTQEVYLVNKEGYMITPSRFIDDVILKQKIELRDIEVASPTEPTAAPLKEEVNIIEDYRGVEVLMVHTHIPEMNWHLLSEIDTKEAFAPVTQLTNTLLLLFAIVLLIVIFISSFISRTITRPLRRLHEGAEEITRGNLNYQVGTTSSDEVGQLSRAFDEMIVRLKISREELEEYSKNLEKKVEERTRDLEIDIEKRKTIEESLRISQQEFDSLFRNSPEALAYLDEKGTFLDANLRFCQLFGYSLSEIKGRNIDDGLIHPPDKTEEGKKLSIKGLTGYLNYETMRKKKDGTLFPVSISATPLLIDGQVKGEIGLYIDISERIQLQNALQESKEKYLGIISSALDAIFYIDHTGSITYCNQAAEKMFGYDEKEMLGKDLHQLIVPSKYHPDFKKGFLAFQETGKGPALGKTWELSALKKTGEEFPVALSLSAVKLKGAWNAIGIIRDISPQKKAEEKLEKLARIDSLTGCYNRGYGLELLDRQMKLSQRSKSPLLLAFLDIDKFKSINDIFGHDEGDLVLKEVVKLFKSTLREIDIICRMGGDEFLLIFPDSSLKEAPLIKERLNKDLIKLNQTLKKPYTIDLSIGFSEYDPANPLAMDELIRLADQRMYEEKKNKKQKKE